MRSLPESRPRKRAKAAMSDKQAVAAQQERVRIED